MALRQERRFYSKPDVDETNGMGVLVKGEI